MSDKTCATCKFYKETKYWGDKPFMECDGPAASHVDATVDDDTNLNTHFKPPSTFGCNGWAKKES